MASRSLQRRLDALERQDAVHQSAPISLRPTGEGRYTDGLYTYTPEAVERLIADLYRTHPIFVLPTDEEARASCAPYESTLTPQDLRRENERVRLAGPPPPDEKAVALSGDAAALRAEPAYLSAVIAHVKKDAAPERERDLLAVVAAGLQEGVSFPLCMRDWLGFPVFEREQTDRLLEPVLRLVEAHPQALVSFELEVSMLLKMGCRAEARRLALAAEQNAELIRESVLWAHDAAVEFLLALCHEMPAETAELRQRIGTDPLLRHKSGFHHLDFDVDLL